MPGFFVSNAQVALSLKDVYPERCVAEAVEASGLTAMRNTLNKFMLDKTLTETEEGIVIAEGFLLNKKALFAQYGVEDMASLLWAMYRQEGETYFAAFRGSFSGALYDRAQDKWLVYTNQIADNTLFYALADGKFYAGTQVNYVIDACKAAGIPLTLDEAGVYQILTSAFMVNDATYAKEIRRLRGGTYLCVEKGVATVKEYHQFVPHREKYAGKTEAELVELVDEAFRAAAEMEFAKDEEYGLEHLSDISGGMDTRATMWVGHAMKPRHMQLITYCRADYLDEVIAKEIADYWKDELLVKPLDDVSFIYDLDQMVFMNGGLCLYSGISGGNRMLNSLNMDRFGLEHTGQMAGTIIGSYYHSMEDEVNHKPTGRFSEKLVHRLPEEIQTYYNNFADHEMYLMYGRGFQGILSTHMMRRNYTEVTTPFMDVDFMQLCFDIHPTIRMSRNLYKKWLLAKYPDTAKFRWEKTGGKFTEGKLRATLRRLVTKGPQKLMRMTGNAKYLKNAMSPMDYWYNTNGDMKRFMDTYETEGYAALPVEASEQLISDMKWLYSTGTVREKAMVLTVLAACKLYFG
ncbi:MAG: hypothetical protein IJ518_04655 [Clostridia bacterium]|nr:hypothetical protein [Clostridia bacterium]